ncbi:hypothetical protein R5R35_012338 [Gryllus longicercus]|uniref:Glutathione peroxidase n=1 Tax=Gryllus longicercus TaxID=2509291 RepID=A0AAN9V7H7_9ORTH
MRREAASAGGAWAALVLLLAATGPAPALAKQQRVPFVYCDTSTDDDSIYNYSATDIHGARNISLADYRGKVVLIANVATY